MPTQPYRTKDGTRVPSVTTILSRFKASDGLIHWAWKLAYEPLAQAKAAPEFLKTFDLEAADYKKIRDRAADAGTCAHDMFECFVKKQEFNGVKYPDPIVQAAVPAYDAACRWATSTKFEVVETEQPLVSERYRFGGTRDACLLDGKRALADYKTSKDIYPEYLCQLGAYAILDEEAGNTIDGGYHLLRFSKQEKPDDPVRFTHYYWSQLDSAKKAFLLMRELYDLMGELGRIAK